MTFTFDSNENLLQNRVFLANPQKKYIGELNSVKEFKIKEVSNNLNEASFLVYEYEDGQRTEYFDDILAKKIVEIQYLGWFEITEINQLQEENSPFEIIKVSCLSLENKLVDKNIDDTNGVYSLYDVTDTEHSLLHIITKLTNWKIGHIDNSLIAKKRTFNIDTNKIYNFLNTEVSKSFECKFVFDTYTKTINAYTLENYGELTDIIIHGRNILKGYERVCKGEEIVTKIKVLGGNGLDIRDVNPTATNYLINIDYFLDWLTVETRNAYNTYHTAYNGLKNNYNTLRATLKTKLQELTTLKAQLVDLEGLKKAKEEVQGSYIQLYSGTPPIGTPEYTLYLAATNAIASYVTQIANKKSEISAKETQVVNTRTQLDNIGVDLNMNNYFTTAQFDELSDFLTEGDTYEDSTFIATDTMSDDEILDMKIELMQNGDNELTRASQPQFTTTISASNLFSMKDEPDSPISYSEWVNKLKVGNLITIKFRDDYWVTARLVEIEVDFNNLSEIQLTFSNKNRFDDKTGQLGEMIANAERTANSLSLFKYGYDQASKQVNEVRELINGTFDATLNAMQSNDNQELYIDTYGLHMRRWLVDQNKYSDYQAWWNTNNLLFSSDGFKTIQTAIGLLTAPDKNTYYGIATSVLIGDLIMGTKLSIINSSGTYTINNNGLTAVNGIYSVGINPNTPSEIFNVKINGVNQFYIDTLTKKLVFSGELVAASGTFSGTVQAGRVIGSSIEGGNFKSSAWFGSPVGSYESEIYIVGGEISAGRTYYLNGVAGTFEKTTTINGSGINTQSGSFTNIDIGNTSTDGITYNNYSFRPKSTRSYDLGSSSYPWNRGYFNSIYLNGELLNNFKQTDINALYPQSNGNSYYVYLNTSRELVSNSTSYNYNIGNSSYPCERGYFKYLYIDGSPINIFAKNSIDSLYSSTSYYITLNSSRELVPNTSSSSYPFSVGSSSYPFDRGYFKNVYIDGTSYEQTISSLYRSSSHYITFNSSGQLIPNTSSSSFNFELGSSSVPFDRVNTKTLYHSSSSGSLGFFGATPTSRKSIAKISSTSSATASSNATKINELLTALAAYGIIIST